MGDPEQQPTDDPDLKKNWYEHGSAMVLFAIGALAIWSLGAIPYAYGALNSSANLQPSPAGAGLFGDSFGAINALLSALGVAFVALALLKQQAELQHTRRELKNTLETNREMAKHQEAMSRTQLRSVAIEALRIHCDSLTAQLSAFTAAASGEEVINDPDVLQRDSAHRLANYYSNELAFASAALSLAWDKPDELLELLPNLNRKTLIGAVSEIGIIATELTRRGNWSGVYLLTKQADSLLWALDQAGYGCYEYMTKELPDDAPDKQMAHVAECCKNAHDDLWHVAFERAVWTVDADID